MERHRIWSHLETPGLEHFRLALRPAEIVADGLVLGLENNLPFRLHYQIRCDPHWRVRHVRVSPLNGEPALTLTANGEGRWFTESGAPLPLLDGCLDVDITATPFTNTLPIRRLALQPGQSADIKVAYLTLPGLQLTPDHQRYTCLAPGSLYKFEQTTTGFTAEIQVDADSLVEQYPELFSRVWAS